MNLALTLEPARWATAAGLGLAYAALCWRQLRLAGRPAALAAPAWTVAYASQGGLAASLAGQTAQALQRAGGSLRCCALDQLDAGQLAAGGRVLLLLSTAGQGEAPDNGRRFEALLRTARPDLGRLDFALLALGDRDYPEFCAFGRRVEALLLEHGARRCFPRIDVDRGDPAALADWQERLRELAGADDFAAGPDEVFSPWQLVDRRHLNPGSTGGAVYRLCFAPPAGMEPHWESGDLVEIQLPAEPDRPRRYSIASVPGEGALHLLVRLHRRPDGQPGALSGWLTGELALGAPVMLRLRAHPLFRLNANRQRPLVCIGNGVGLAGLRGHLAGRVAAGLYDNWLLFGERSEACDFHAREELAAWQAAGRLARLDTVFSRDGGDFRYVQDCLAAQADTFRAWVARGAAVYVCGSRRGMGEGVEQTIRTILGDEGFDHLRQGGRYCRDVF